MSRSIVVLLMHLRHKLLDLINPCEAYNHSVTQGTFRLIDILTDIVRHQGLRDEK
jgi:hypothetical protein